MSTADFSSDTPEPNFPKGQPTSGSPARRPRNKRGPLLSALGALASLRLTVVLLAMLTFLVFVGTLAQVEHDIWHVVRVGYFRVWFAFVEFQTLPALLGVFKPNDIKLPGGFWFPGGYLIGAVMAVNLLVAHGLRFKVSARGNRLWGGLALLAVGIAATAVVVTRAFDSSYDSNISPEMGDLLWQSLRAGLTGISIASAYWLFLAWRRIRLPEWSVLATLNLLAFGLAVWLLFNPQWQINSSSMRIVWQMLQSLAATCLLLAGCWLLFRKRAGVVLLHAGIVILMAHEFYTGHTAVEANMVIEEGQTVNFASDSRVGELAFILHAPNQDDRVTVIPDTLLKKAAALPADAPGRVIRHPDVPVDIRVVEYYTNASIFPNMQSKPTPATFGSGTRLIAVKLPPASGLSNTINIPASYVELLDKKSGKSLGTLLLSTYFDPSLIDQLAPRNQRMPGMPPAETGEQSLSLDGKTLGVAMRWKRIYKDYTVTLIKFSHDVYTGTNKAKNFSSLIRLQSPKQDIDITSKIWMNNPLRFQGETFYQADWNKFTESGTKLQVVKNESWMLPYLGCAIVLIGMMVHFGITLIRFLGRRTTEQARLKETKQLPARVGWGSFTSSPEAFFFIFIPTCAALLVAGYLGSKLRTPEIIVDDMPVHEFAALPVVDQGRVKPFDTVARNTLQYFSARQEANVSLDGKNKVPATQWLLDVVSRKENFNDYYVFRITNLELIDAIGLPRRSGFFRYSFADLIKQEKNLLKQLNTKLPEKNPSPFQKQIKELNHKLAVYQRLIQAYQIPKFLNSTGTEEKVKETLQADMELYAELKNSTVIRAIVPTQTTEAWNSLYGASVKSIPEWLEGRPGNLPARQLMLLLDAYRFSEVKEFKKYMAEYHVSLSAYEKELNDPANAAVVDPMKSAERLSMAKIGFEQRYNAAAPFFYCAVMYLIALILSSLAWLGWSQVLGRSATAIIIVTLVVHTLALVARMYISGRPPITNLYTTAIFNGWAVVLAMLVIESIYKIGIGNFVASAVGFATLLIAHFLGLDEDTFTVMQAVLDTQFWLTTHVITINLGYATTILAGSIGIIYIFQVHLPGAVDKEKQQQLGRMIYGTLCFALFFSFIGTVLGGLWADDSWGRFWGWDPKENGALMIVLWNALALHARWGKMVDTRGLAMLVIVGNIITAWSWFGVNQLGQGLHAYGFNNGLAQYLLWFLTSQCVLLPLAMFPSRRVLDLPPQRKSP